MKNLKNTIVYIIDTGLGNVGSVGRMIERVGGNPMPISTPDEIDRCSKVILPGVGHFDHGILSLQRCGFGDSFWASIVEQGTIIMGICLGMQLLCASSEEGLEPGLGLVDANVCKFSFHSNSDSELKIPHMGWNTISTVRDNPLMPYTDEERRFYFVHSYKVVANDPTITIATADYGGEFCAAFQKDNIFGVQFHPEKSHRFGMELMKRFIEL